nr:uncharacterized protein LOC109402899 [Aedes albopictus]
MIRSVYVERIKKHRRRNLRRNMVPVEALGERTTYICKDQPCIAWPRFQTLRSQWPGIVSCNNDSGSVFFKAGMQGKSSDYMVKPSSGGLWIQDHTRWQQQQLLIVVVNFQEQHPRPNHQVFPVDLCRKSASRVES